MAKCFAPTGIGSHVLLVNTSNNKSLETILRKTKEIVESGNKEKGIKNLNEGISSDGRSGKEFFSISEKLINLNNVFLPDEVKDEIISLINLLTFFFPLCFIPTGCGSGFSGHV